MRPGSLICITSDDFETFRLATVAGERDAINLKQGRFYFKFEESHDENNNIDALAYIGSSIVYTVAESPAFFEVSSIFFN